MDTEAKKTILIVDDVELNRRILSLVLSDKYHIVEADSGVSAMEALQSKEHQISLILLDIVMPVMDGFSFLKHMQEVEEYKSIPVILVTAETYEENVLEGIKMGVRDVIAKPFPPDLILKRVDNLILLSEKEQAGAVPLTINEKTGLLRNTALIVDDVRMNRSLLKNALEDGYLIMEAANGKEGLDLLRKHNEEIAVILLDIIMPIMDGFDMMKAAKRCKLLNNIPVIAITAEDSLSKLNAMMEVGICELIQKPFTPTVVKNRVDYIIRLSQKSI